MTRLIKRRNFVPNFPSKRMTMNLCLEEKSINLHLCLIHVAHPIVTGSGFIKWCPTSYFVNQFVILSLSTYLNIFMLVDWTKTGRQCHPLFLRPFVAKMTIIMLKCKCRWWMRFGKGFQQVTRRLPGKKGSTLSWSW